MVGQDVYDFRNIFGGFGGVLNIILNGPDPGDLGGGEEAEATLDASWAAVMAPNALVDFVVSAGTNATDGIFLSESYIIDNNLAPVMTESFGGCESGVPDAEAQAISALAEQAAAQGITYIVSSGDIGRGRLRQSKSERGTRDRSPSMYSLPLPSLWR